MNITSQQNNRAALRYGMFIPLAMLIASVVSGCFSYSKARQTIADDLNDAMVALTNENCGLWTRQDTITALRHMYCTTGKPLIFQASDITFRNPALKDKAYYSLAFVDNNDAAPAIYGDKIISDSIILVPETTANGFVIKVQGFAECSVASVLAVSDQRVPGVLLSLSFISIASMLGWRRKTLIQLPPSEKPMPVTPVSLDGIRLTPMQRQLTQMLLDAPDKRVDKTALCAALWGNKSNAEESLYTLIRRTKIALAETRIEIICNRGDSYELHVKG